MGVKTSYNGSIAILSSLLRRVQIKEMMYSNKRRALDASTSLTARVAQCYIVVTHECISVQADKSRHLIHQEEGTVICPAYKEWWRDPVRSHRDQAGG